MKNRFMIAIPLFAVGIALTFKTSKIIWRYFAWSNQTLANDNVMDRIDCSLVKKLIKTTSITAIPAIFMTVVTFSYIMQAPEGFKLSPAVGNGIGLVAGLILAVLFFNKVRKVKDEGNKEHIV